MFSYIQRKFETFRNKLALRPPLQSATFVLTTLPDLPFDEGVKGTYLVKSTDTSVRTFKLTKARTLRIGVPGESDIEVSLR